LLVSLVIGESLWDEKPPASHISRTLKPSAITSHPIINGRDQSTSDALFAKRLNVNVMINIHPPLLQLTCSIRTSAVQHCRVEVVPRPDELVRANSQDVTILNRERLKK